MKIGVGAVGGSIGGSNKGAVFFKICTDPWDELQSMLLGQGLCSADASFHLHRVEHTGVGATLPLGGRFAPLQHPQHPQQRQNSWPPHSKPTNTRHSNNRVITQLLNDCSWSGKKTIMLTNTVCLVFMFSQMASHASSQICVILRSHRSLTPSINKHAWWVKESVYVNNAFAAFKWVPRFYLRLIVSHRFPHLLCLFNRSWDTRQYANNRSPTRS